MQTLPWVLATYVPLEVLYVVAVWRVTGRVARSSLAENRWFALFSYVLAAALTSGLAVLVGQLWAIALEILRVGDGHLGNRTAFIPYMQIQERTFVFGVVVFTLVVAARRYLTPRTHTENAAHMYAGRSATPPN